MAHEYYLLDFALTAEPDDFIAVVVNQGTSSLRDLALVMQEQGNLSSVEDLLKLFRDVQQAARTLLNQGYRVTGPLSIVSPGILGVFYGEQDNFDPLRHDAQLNAIPSPEFEQMWGSAAIFDKVVPK